MQDHETTAVWAKVDEVKSMYDNRTTEFEPQTINEIDTDFHKVRDDLRIVFWMVSASLVMTGTIFIGVIFMGLPS